MAGQGAFQAFAALTVALAGMPAMAQQPPGVADFLSTIGGDTDMKTSGSLRTRPSPQVFPLLDDAEEIIGYRFFAEKITADGSATAVRARDAFAHECVAKGGRIEPEDGDAARSFRDRALGRRLPPRGEFKHFWSGISAVCSRGPDQVLGGFVAITYDTTEVATKGDLGSRLISHVSMIPTRTAVYAYRPDQIRSAAWFQRAQDSYVADREAEQKRREAFRRDLAIGTVTNCGTVIQIRGPMVEIAVPPTTLTPNGQSTFWSRRDTLAPTFSTPCTYGL
ncbi:hypothetical protein [Sphingomonas aracearum]|nr:hypothetical protein [Sphingomonas aracearum]